MPERTQHSVTSFLQSLKKQSAFLRREAELARIEMDVRGRLSRTAEANRELREKGKKPAGQWVEMKAPGSSFRI